MATNRDVALAWIEYAEKDFNAAKLLFDNNRGYYDELSLYHAHQAVEKAVRSILIIEEFRFPKIHDLNLLTQKIKDDVSKIEIENSIKIFEKFEPEIRYPEGGIEVTFDEIEIAIQVSGREIEIAKKRIV